MPKLLLWSVHLNEWQQRVINACERHTPMRGKNLNKNFFRGGGIATQKITTKHTRALIGNLLCSTIIFVFAFRSAYLFSRPSQCDQIGRFFGSNTNIWRLFGLLIFKTSLSSLNCSGFFWKKFGNFLLQQLVTLALTVVCLFVLLRVISTCDL